MNKYRIIEDGNSNFQVQIYDQEGMAWNTYRRAGIDCIYGNEAATRGDLPYVLKALKEDARLKLYLKRQGQVVRVVE